MAMPFTKWVIGKFFFVKTKIPSEFQDDQFFASIFSETDLDDDEGPVVNNSQYRIASAIYPSASMMNHSCDPTVINSFYNHRLIVRAIKPVNAGDEVFNCYGPHFRHHRYDA